MKNLIIILSLLFITTGCSNEPVQHKDVEMEIRLTDSSVYTVVYELPIDAKVFIHTIQGSYWLMYSSKLEGTYMSEIRAAVIDVKVLSETPLPLPSTLPKDTVK